VITVGWRSLTSLMVWVKDETVTFRLSLFHDGEFGVRGGRRFGRGSRDGRRCMRRGGKS
jgi:hypothetical protein